MIYGYKLVKKSDVFGVKWFFRPLLAFTLMCLTFSSVSLSVRVFLMGELSDEDFLGRPLRLMILNSLVLSCIIQYV